MVPSSDLYKLERLISENNLTESWAATRLDTGEKCFVKCPSGSPELSLSQKNDILLKSYKLQSRLRTSVIHSACAANRQDGKVFVEYTYLEPSRLSPISIESQESVVASSLTQMALIVDYFHLLGLSHCDLKLDNFRTYSNAKGTRLILLDLDNIRVTDSKPDNRVVGTPSYIAPEFLNNDRITIKSDIFSLGCSISHAIILTGNGVGIERVDHGSRDKLKLLADILSQKHPIDRPELLLDALQSVELISPRDYSQALKSVLSAILLTRFRSLSRSTRRNGVDLQKDLFVASDLFSLPAELVDDLHRKLEGSPRVALKVFKQLLARSEVARHGDFWHMEIPDDAMVSAFSQLSRDSDRLKAQISLPESTQVVPGAISSIDTDDVEPVHSLKRYLHAKQQLSSPPELSKEVPSLVVLEHMSELAVALNRPEEAAKFLQAALERVAPEEENYLSLLQQCVQQMLASGSIESAEVLIDKGLTVARELSQKDKELDLRRLKAWVISHTGDHAKSEKLLRQIISEAGALDLVVVEAKALGDLAGSLMLDGRLEDARIMFEKCVTLADTFAIQAKVATTFYSFSLLCFKTAEYRLSISLAKDAARHLEPSRQSHLFPFIFQVIAENFTRLAEYKKADHWFARCLTAIHHRPGHLSYAIYYGNIGWSYMVRGRNADAEISLGRSLSMAKAAGNRGQIALCFRNLAEIALIQGDSNKCTDLVSQALEALETRPNQVVVSELALVACLNEYFYYGSKDLQTCLEAATELVGHSCLYFASLALFVIVLEADQAWLDERHDELVKLFSRLPSNQSPICEALGHIVPIINRQDVSFEESIRGLKDAYRVLEASGNSFLASLTCERVARQYFGGESPRLGTKFLKQAEALAEQLSNDILASRFRELRMEQSGSISSRYTLINSFDGIADILSSLDHDSDPLRRILQFAVDTVEAERGVLLLCNRDTGDLRVKAYINCDDASLNDIVDYSRNIPMATLTSSSPVYVADALSDSSTRMYKSIVAHNIRSVICVPISFQGKTEGVIYLDHQTIPALFAKDDLQFVQALSKFASMMLDKVLRRDSARQRTAYLESNLAELGVGSKFITQNGIVKALLNEIPPIAASNIGVLVRGESGTGKEILCKLIHELSPRRNRPFVKLNCAAMTPSLVESELFGVADRTATGVKARAGKLEAADGGTLFLDEIGDMPLSLQAKVLRVLEHQEFERVGSNKPICTDIRFIYATNRDLKDMVLEKLFRQDLYYRICGIEIAIPPLRERPDDISLLTEHFCRLYAGTNQKQVRFSFAAMQVLESHSWPGNVRELRNIMERLTLLLPGKTIQERDLPGDLVRVAQSNAQSSSAAQAIEKARIRSTLERQGWNQSAAARELSMNLASFRRRMKKYNISRP